MDTVGRTKARSVFRERNRSEQEDKGWDAPNHGNSDGPRGSSDTEAEVAVVGSLVLARLHVVDDLGETTENVGGEGLREDEVESDR